MLYTRENGNKLEMFWRPNFFDILSDFILSSALQLGGGKVRVKTGDYAKGVDFQ